MVVEDRPLIVHGRVWVVLRQDTSPDDVYFLGTGDHADWSLQPQGCSAGEFLTFGLREGLVLLKPDDALVATTPELLEIQADGLARQASTRGQSDAILRGNLRPSRAQGGARAWTDGAARVVVVEPDADVELILEQPGDLEQVLVVLSWRKPSAPGRWIILRSEMTPAEQVVLYEGTPWFGMAYDDFEQLDAAGVT